MDFFYNSICHVCKEYKEGRLKRCGSCKFVAYCSKEHQISDWKNHKQICRLLKKGNNVVNIDINCGYDRWRIYRTRLQFYLTQNLGREMELHENQMWMFPRACAVCYCKENLMDCENCLCVAYCTKEHQESNKEVHSLVCPELKLCLDYDCFNLKHKEINIKLKEIDENLERLPQIIQHCMEIITDMSNCTDSLQKIYRTDIFTTILTIIYGLEKTKLLEFRNLKLSDLVVHIVGADISELSLDWNLNFLFLNKWIKNLNTCKLIFIGPDCESIQISHHCNNISIQIVNKYYHDVENLDEPNVIVALNSGLHEFQFDKNQDTWMKSLNKLINNDAPLVLTSYTRQELEDDLKRFEFFPKKTILNIQKNPFSNIRPLRDWDSKEYAPFYVNGYIAIIAGRNYK